MEALADLKVKVYMKFSLFTIPYNSFVKIVNIDIVRHVFRAGRAPPEILIKERRRKKYMTICKPLQVEKRLMPNFSNIFLTNNCFQL